MNNNEVFEQEKKIMIARLEGFEDLKKQCEENPKWALERVVDIRDGFIYHRYVILKDRVNN